MQRMCPKWASTEILHDEVDIFVVNEGLNEFADIRVV